MVQVTCYGGVGRIGGNQFLLEDGETRLFFDFGIPYSERGQFYEEYLKPRPSFGVLDLLTMDLLPLLRGLYRADLEQGLPDLWGDFEGKPSFRDLRDTPIAGILLSHAHLDHSGYISFVREDIPIYAGAATAFVAKAVQDSGRGDLEGEVVYAAPRQVRAGGLLEATDYRRVPAQQRPFGVFGYESLPEHAHAFWGDMPGARPLARVPLKPAGAVAGLEVRCFRVDHSLPGACAFAAKTSVGWIAHTGDLRFHGEHGHLSRHFVEELKALRPVAVLCEGTRADLEQAGTANYTEHDVHERALAAVREAQGLVIADFGPRNVERLLTFASIANESGRALVIQAKDAYLLRAVHLADPSVPAVMDIADLHVYDEPKLRLDRWERSIREECGSRLVGPGAIHRHQDSYILCFSFYDLDQLPTIKPRAGSLYLYSSHEAFNEELQLDFRRLRAWIDHFGMRRIGLPIEELDWSVPEQERGLHASGHADANSLAELVREVAPEFLIPIHTEERGIAFFQRRAQELGIPVIIPSRGIPIRLLDGV